MRVDQHTEHTERSVVLYEPHTSHIRRQVVHPAGAFQYISTRGEFLQVERPEILDFIKALIPEVHCFDIDRPNPAISLLYQASNQMAANEPPGSANYD